MLAPVRFDNSRPPCRSHPLYGPLLFLVFLLTAVLATPCDDTSLRVAYENAKGAATTAVQKSGASYCAMKEAQSKMLANSCGVLSPSQSPRPYAGNEDGLTTCVQAAIAPLQTGFFEPTLISGNRDVFSGAIPPKSVFPVSVGCAYQNVVATAVRFRTPANQQAGSIRLWQLNGINLLLSLTPNAVSRSDIGDYLIGIYDDDGAVVPAPKTQVCGGLSARVNESRRRTRLGLGLRVADPHLHAHFIADVLVERECDPDVGVCPLGPCGLGSAEPERLVLGCHYSRGNRDVVHRGRRRVEWL